jgi:hypothetical protein
MRGEMRGIVDAFIAAGRRRFGRRNSRDQAANGRRQQREEDFVQMQNDRLCGFRR